MALLSSGSFELGESANKRRNVRVLSAEWIQDILHQSNFKAWFWIHVVQNFHSAFSIIFKQLGNKVLGGQQASLEYAAIDAGITFSCVTCKL